MRLIFDRFPVKGVVTIGLCAAAVALSPYAAASPLKTGGYNCLDKASGAAGPCSAIADEASGLAAPVLGAPPGPPLAPPPVVPPLAPPPLVPPPLGPPPVPPVVPPLAPPVGAPLAPAAAGAAISEASGIASGKGVPTDPQTTGGPAEGVPTLPG